MRVSVEEHTGDGYPQSHLFVTFKDTINDKWHALRGDYDSVNTYAPIGSEECIWQYKLSNGEVYEIGDKLFVGEFECSREGARKLWEKMTSKGFEVV